MSWALMPMDPLKLLVDWASHGSVIKRQILRMVCKRFRTAVNSVPMTYINMNVPGSGLNRRDRYDVMSMFYSEYGSIVDKQIHRDKMREFIAIDTRRFFIECSNENYLTLMKWACDVMCIPFNKSFTCIHAIRAGHLDMLIYLRSKGVPYSCAIIQEAAAFGHTNIISWALGELEDVYRKAYKDEQEAHTRTLKNFEKIEEVMHNLTGVMPRKSKEEHTNTPLFWQLYLPVSDQSTSQTTGKRKDR